MAKQRYKKIQAGRLVREALWTPAFTCNNQTERAARQRATTEARRRINLRTSWERLKYLLAANFTGSDGVWTLEFDDKHLPPNRAEARKIIKKFVAQLRQVLRSRGQELKYVYALECQHGEKRLHFHFVVNLPAADIALVKSLWTYGYAWSKAVDTYEGYTGLAKYLTKEARQEGARVGAHSWAASRNLAKPTEHPTEWVSESTSLNPPPQARILESTHAKINEYGYFCYLEYMLPPEPVKSPGAA